MQHLAGGSILNSQTSLLLDYWVCKSKFIWHGPINREWDPKLLLWFIMEREIRHPIFLRVTGRPREIRGFAGFSGNCNAECRGIWWTPIFFWTFSVKKEPVVVRSSSWLRRTSLGLFNHIIVRNVSSSFTVSTCMDAHSDFPQHEIFDFPKFRFSAALCSETFSKSPDSLTIRQISIQRTKTQAPERDTRIRSFFGKFQRGTKWCLMDDCNRTRIFCTEGSGCVLATLLFEKEISCMRVYPIDKIVHPIQTGFRPETNLYFSARCREQKNTEKCEPEVNILWRWVYSTLTHFGDQNTLLWWVYSTLKHFGDQNTLWWWVYRTPTHFGDQNTLWWWVYSTLTNFWDQNTLWPLVMSL